MSNITAHTDAHVAEAIVAIVESTNQDPMPMWGNAYKRNLNLVQHQAWHPEQGARTFERTQVNGEIELYRFVRELRLVFQERMSETPIGEPIREDVLFEITAILRQPLTNRLVWQLCLTHHAPDHEGRTEWTRHLVGQPTVKHYVAPKGSNKFVRCQSGFEQIRMISAMENDLPVGLLTLFSGQSVTATASA